MEKARRQGSEESRWWALKFCFKFFQPICPRPPLDLEYTSVSGDLHPHSTLASSATPPSLWPGRELRAYHCPSCASWRNAGATRILLLMVPAADQADSRSAKPEYTGSGLFNFQKTCKHGGCFTQVKRKVTVVIQDICIATVIRALENVPGV